MEKWKPFDRAMLELNPRAHIWVRTTEKSSSRVKLWTCEKCGATFRLNSYNNLGPPGPFVQVTGKVLYCDEYLVSRLLSE